MEIMAESRGDEQKNIPPDKMCEESCIRTRSTKFSIGITVSILDSTLDRNFKCNPQCIPLFENPIVTLNVTLNVQL